MLRKVDIFECIAAYVRKLREILNLLLYLLYENWLMYPTSKNKRVWSMCADAHIVGTWYDMYDIMPTLID